MSSEIELNRAMHRSRIVLGDAHRNGVCDCIAGHGTCHICGSTPEVMPKSKDHVFCVPCFAQYVSDGIAKNEPDDMFEEGELEDLAKQLADIIMEEIVQEDDNNGSGV